MLEEEEENGEEVFRKEYEAENGKGSLAEGERRWGKK